MAVIQIEPLSQINAEDSLVVAVAREATHLGLVHQGQSELMAMVVPFEKGPVPEVDST